MADANELDRIPPQNLEAEMAVLGSVLVDRSVLWDVESILHASDFYAHVHELLWQTILRLFVASQPIDKISVAEELRARGILEKIGGLSYLNALMDTVQTAASAKYYATIVHEKAILRELGAVGRELVDLSFSGQEDVAGTINRAASIVGVMLDAGTPRRAVDTSEALLMYEMAMDEVHETVHSSPWPLLDRKTGGYMAGDVTIWGGVEGLGKTMLVTQLAAWIAERFGHVAFFSTEMGTVKSMARFIAMYSGVSVRHQREGAGPTPERVLKQLEVEAISLAKQHILGLPISMIDASPALSSDDIIAQCRKLHRVNPLRAVIIDTVHMLSDIESGNDKRDRSTHERQKRALKALRQCALDVKFPLHLVMHVNRPDERVGKNLRPQRNRLLDGGNAERIASTIVFAHEDANAGMMLIADKTREGVKGDIPMNFHGHRALWLQDDQRLAWFEPPSDPEPDLLELGAYP